METRYPRRSRFFILLAKHFPGRRESKLIDACAMVILAIATCQALSRSEGIETEHGGGSQNSRRTYAIC